MEYDIIGDIHGQARELRRWLQQQDYVETDGVYRHRCKTLVFLGDFVDRGPDCRGVVDIARAMVEAGTALAVMGNHEFNALCYATSDPNRPTGYLRPHHERNRRQHATFLDSYEDDPDARRSALAWFHRLPLWLDLGELRIVHACWRESQMRVLRDAGFVDEGARLCDGALSAMSEAGTPAFWAIEVLLKGIEIELPEGIVFTDEGGIDRHHVRVRWWRQGEDPSWRDIALGPSASLSRLPDEPVSVNVGWGYPSEAPPVFIGHYWFSGEPAPLADNVACVDYSVAKENGKLVGYRWEGPGTLSADRFVTVERLAST